MSPSKLKRNTLIGLAVSILLAIGKFIVGVVGNSSAIIADAVESFADAIGSLVVLQGIRVAHRAPDMDHPYGYGKAEALAALGVGAILMLAAIAIVVEAFRDMMTPHNAPAPWTLYVLIAVILVKEFLFRLVLHGAEEFESDAARADAWHHRADAITSAAALVGVAIAIWGPKLLHAPDLVLADEAAAMIASGIIFLTAWRLIRPSLWELLDGVHHDLAADVAKTAAQVEGVSLIEKVHARKSGGGYHVDMHMHVPGDMGVQAAHSLSGKVKATVMARHKSVRNVLIHIEPEMPS